MSAKNNNPLAEVFGFPSDCESADAKRYRKHQLCPFNNKSPNCTKDKISNPLGVCSVNSSSHGQVITCPTRFRQDWRLLDDAAQLMFPADAKWTAIPEVRLKDGNGRAAGNIDIVLVRYDDHGHVIDFGAVEIQAVYISGNVRDPFNAYMKVPTKELDWPRDGNYPTPDFLSSSRKRLVPQLLYKGTILHAWGKKTVVVLDVPFFKTLPMPAKCSPATAEIFWLVYSLETSDKSNQLQLSLRETLCSKFQDTMAQMSVSVPGDSSEFVKTLQSKLDEKRAQSTAPTTLLPKIGL